MSVSLTVQCWRLGALLEHAYRMAPGTKGMNQTQLLILVALLDPQYQGRQRRGATPTGLAGAIGCARTRTSMQLKAMVELGLLEVSIRAERQDRRAELAEDHRQRYFWLTKRGIVVAKSAVAAIAWVDREIRKSVTAKKHDEAVRTLVAARDALEQAPFLVAGRQVGERTRNR